MTHSRKTKSKNQRSRRRSGKNIFYLVMSTRAKELILYARKPHTFQVSEEYKDLYKDGLRWDCAYDEYYPPMEVAKRIPVDYKTPLLVKLIICGNDPDMYIQRYKDCLFINAHLETYYCGGERHNKITRVPHTYRISTKLFPDVTEESGIVGIKIVQL